MPLSLPYASFFQDELHEPYLKSFSYLIEPLESPHGWLRYRGHFS